MNTTLTPADLDPRRQAMLLYFQGYRVARIAEMLGEESCNRSQLEEARQMGRLWAAGSDAAHHRRTLLPAHYEGAERRERLQGN